MRMGWFQRIVFTFAREIRKADLSISEKKEKAESQRMNMQVELFL